MVDLPPFEEFNRINESDGFDPSEAQRRLKDKAQENLRRYRVAQERGDNYAIRRYELLLQLDKVEEKGLKIKVELHRLKEKFKK
jgi:hypothetical protein